MSKSRKHRSGKYTTQMDTPKGLRVARKSIRRRILQRRRKRIAMLFAKKHERTPVHEASRRAMFLMPFCTCGQENITAHVMSPLHLWVRYKMDVDLACVSVVASSFANSLKFTHETLRICFCEGSIQPLGQELHRG